jgi:hypothetical protein
MGFLDKAKKLAEQAQQKLDEAQTQFNQGGSTQGQPQPGGVQYDAHGRPIAQPPAADVPPPVAQPQPPVAQPESPPAPPAADPAAPAGEEQPQAAEPPTPPPAPPAGGEGAANSSPDPFKPLQQ